MHICDFNGCLQRRPANPGKVLSSGSGSTIGSSIGATRKMSKKAGTNFDPKVGVNRNQVLSSILFHEIYSDSFKQVKLRLTLTSRYVKRDEVKLEVKTGFGSDFEPGFETG